MNLKEALEKYEPIIGLEVHIELKTKSKMFCDCPADHFKKEPNTQTCPVCLGLPGALPVPNKQALRWTIMIAKALNCKINLEQQFDRKHYFYPDLPKGYQITQLFKPAGEHGFLEVPTKTGIKKFDIRRIHLEEDTAKMTHKNGETFINFNRSGVPLVEIVTEPVFHNAEDAKAYLKQLHLIVRYLGVSDADLEKGSMRLEPNISLRKRGDTKLPPYKVEVKNINSFNFVAKAINYEIVRHAEILESGDIPQQETRGFNPGKSITYTQRVKTEEANYRYFPDPDIPPVVYTQKEIDEILQAMPELPITRYKILTQKLKLRHDIAMVLTEDKVLGDLFANIITQNEDIDKVKFATFIVNKKSSLNLNNPNDVVKQYKASINVATISEDEIEELVKQVISENPKAVEDYKNGKTNAIQFLLGMTMKKIGKKVDVKPIIEVLKRELENT